MTELDILEPAMRRLFEEVDLASIPRSRLAQEASAVWRLESATDLNPPWQNINCRLKGAVRGSSFLLERTGGDYVFLWAGPHLPLKASSQHTTSLMKLKDRRLAVRIRRTANYVGSRGEPITVRFPVQIDHEKGEGELYLAPVVTDRAQKAFFGVLAMRRERHTW